MYWVLFFITDNQEFQHGSPGVLGFIFYNGQQRNSPGIRTILGFIFYLKTHLLPHGMIDGSPGVLGFIFYIGRPRNPTWESRRTGFQVYWVLFLITDNQEIQHGRPGVLGFIFYNGHEEFQWESCCTGFFFP